jgi:hypothetical protein
VQNLTFHKRFETRCICRITRRYDLAKYQNKQRGSTRTLEGGIEWITTTKRKMVLQYAYVELREDMILLKIRMNKGGQQEPLKGKWYSNMHMSNYEKI